MKFIWNPKRLFRIDFTNYFLQVVCCWYFRKESNGSDQSSSMGIQADVLIIDIVLVEPANLFPRKPLFYANFLMGFAAEIFSIFSHSSWDKIIILIKLHISICLGRINFRAAIQFWSREINLFIYRVPWVLSSIFERVVLFWFLTINSRLTTELKHMSNRNLAFSYFLYLQRKFKRRSVLHRGLGSRLGRQRFKYFMFPWIWIHSRLGKLLKGNAMKRLYLLQGLLQNWEDFPA